MPGGCSSKLYQATAVTVSLQNSTGNVLIYPVYDCGFDADSGVDLSLGRR